MTYELGLGNVLRWPIVSRSTLQDGLYHYDAIAQLQDMPIATPQGGDPATPGAPGSVEGIGSYIRSNTPRALLIDELGKSDIDLPNDLLNALEEGEFAISELERVADRLPDAIYLTAATVSQTCPSSSSTTRGEPLMPDATARHQRPQRCRTNAPQRATAARRAPPHPPHSTTNDLPLPRFPGHTGSGRPIRKSALPGELPMPDQGPTPATHTPHPTRDTESRIVSFRWPGKPTLSTGACFTYAFSLGGTLATGRISDPTRTWQLVVLAVTAMACGTILAITQRTLRHSTNG